MGRGTITASRTACLRAEQEVASRGEKCARLFQSGRKSRKIDSATPATRCLMLCPGPCAAAADAVQLRAGRAVAGGKLQHTDLGRASGNECPGSRNRFFAISDPTENSRAHFSPRDATSCSARKHAVRDAVMMPRPTAALRA